MGNEDRLPRGLTEQERGLLLWLLPADRPGYLAYRKLAEAWQVVARGRRGEGNYILAASDEQPDVESPLPQLLACGVIETPEGNISVTLRERLGNQIEYEIVNLQGDVVPARLQEVRRWTLSSWLPQQACPACGGALREVAMFTKSGGKLVLAVCPSDGRLWVHEEESGINHPIPVTNFYNELMLHRNVRVPAVALESKRLFLDLNDFTDVDLIRAFVTYNKLRTKVTLDRPIVVPQERKPSWLKRIARAVSVQKK